MTTAEWGILLAALGFMVTIVTLIVRLTSTLTRVDVTLQNLNDKITDINCENKRQHDEFSSVAREQGEKLADHETRIAVIENKPRRKSAGA